MQKKRIPDRKSGGWLLAGACVWLYFSLSAQAQDLEPRRWSHLPADINFAGVGYGYTRADIYFDPVLDLEDVTLDLHTVVAKYLRTFALLSRSVRVEILAPVQDAHWQGLLQGAPASRHVGGLADPMARFAVNLIGAPPLQGPAFAEYQAAHPANTIVGAALAVQAPLGQYDKDRLLNLGENRFVFRPELGAVHSHGKWSEEVTGSVWLFTDNDDFWKGNHREQDPFTVVQGHLVYTFRPGLWISGGAGYGFGGQSTVNGVSKDDRRGNLVSGFSVGLPINRAVGVKLGYAHSATQEDTGSDSDTLAAAVSVLW